MWTRMLVAVVLTAVAALLIARQTRNASPPAAPGPTDSFRGLDPGGYRDLLASRRSAARAMAERHALAVARRATPPGPDEQAAPAAPAGGRLAASLVAPTCILGPADLCALVADPVEACDRGDAQACLAVGQFLEDEPPRPLIVVSFYHHACKGGEQAACARMKQLGKDAPTVACKADPVACAWHAMRTKDAAVLDEACRFGVADACAFMLEHTQADPTRARGYLERACQLGNPMTCEELAARLSPTCTTSCYPPDPDAVTAAATIACDAGFTAACARLP